MRLFLCSLLMVAIASAAFAQGAALLSHRAVYDLGLARADSGSGVTGARGRLVMEWADACGGFTLSQRIRNELRQSEGNFVADLSVSTWEASDGLAFRFSSRHVVDDKTVEEVRGRATMSGGAQDGEAVFQKPADSKLKLPGNAIFPTRHTQHLIERAVNGDKIIRAVVFDGSGSDGLMNTTAVVIQHFAPGTYQGQGEKALAGLDSWRMKVAYFKIDAAGGDSQPDYEVGFRLFANGVSTDVELDYGDFALKGALKILEPLPDNC